ncbi:hypothetical protein [Euzebyella saccharophila]|uniref:Uncharacterized protein n=1 Tax=Euzebyella saccharophila TaxID=679664 RepID=A0ABV8JIY5_9FLAO|nr:hypothetical protein [Euzebyella saccharophila]
MKTFVSFVFILFIGTVSYAQEGVDVKVNTIEKTIVMNVQLEKDVKIEKHEVARLYKRDNARVKKALTFSTKRSRAKMA